MVIYVWWYTYGGIRMVIYVWWYTYGGIRMVVYVWWYTYGGIRMVVYVWWYGLGDYVVRHCYCDVPATVLVSHIPCVTSRVTVTFLVQSPCASDRMCPTCRCLQESGWELLHIAANPRTWQPAESEHVQDTDPERLPSPCRLPQHPAPDPGVRLPLLLLHCTRTAGDRDREDGDPGGHHLAELTRLRLLHAEKHHSPRSVVTDCSADIIFDLNLFWHHLHLWDSCTAFIKQVKFRFNNNCINSIAPISLTFQAQRRNKQNHLA